MPLNVRHSVGFERQASLAPSVHATAPPCVWAHTTYVARLVIGDPTEDTKTSMMLQMDLGNSPQQQQPFKAEPAFKGECDNLEISRYRSVIESSEKMLLGAKYPMAKAVARKAGNGRNAGDDIFQNFKKKESKEPGLVDESKKGK